MKKRSYYSIIVIVLFDISYLWSFIIYVHLIHYYLKTELKKLAE